MQAKRGDRSLRRIFHHTESVSMKLQKSVNFGVLDFPILNGTITL